MRILLLLIFLVLNVKAQELPNSVQKLDKYLDYLYENNLFYGEVAVYLGNYKFYHKQKVLSDDQNKSLYGLGQIRNAFVCAGLYHLLEKKKLALDNDLKNYFDWFEPTIKIEDLVYHRLVFDHKQKSFDIELAKRVLSSGLKEHFNNCRINPNSSKLTYSNLNFLLLEKVIEKVTKQSFNRFFMEQFVQVNQLQSLRYLKKSHFNKWERYLNWPKNFQDNKWNDNRDSVHSQWFSGTHDLIKFVNKLFKGAFFEKSSTLKLFLKTYHSYGAGYFLMPFSDRNYYLIGNASEYQNLIATYPKEQLTICIINCAQETTHRIDAILKGVLSIYYKYPFTISSEKLNSTANTLDSFIGVYYLAEDQEGIRSFIILKDQEVLYLQSDKIGRLRLDYLTKNTFVSRKAHMQIIFNSNGLELIQDRHRLIYFKKK